MNVGSIDEEILIKGLEISNMKYTRSMGCANNELDSYFNSDIRKLEQKLDNFLMTCPDKRGIDDSSDSESEDDNILSDCLSPDRQQEIGKKSSNRLD